ncbi:MAG: hypothetical protein H6622_01610 [Halobacteriovoraceae bacterium]|nr:hypothetical protein [Halobacteriovoraceae bacterium]
MKELICEKHKKYKGKKLPKYNCEVCLQIFLFLKSTKAPSTKQQRVHRDKSKYNRKDKFKKENT